METYICIHGHFYQPPRENPWLEAIELQDSAAPYHDWNERIAAECYAPNSVSRILDDRDRIVKLVNNYAKISFNFGPTLLSWLEAEAPEVYAAILAADRESQQQFSGHGSALAQIYNHLIMPLANSRDRATQILWGIRDFEKRFKRAPEGMWLPETAVDLETLELLAEHGIRFTILAPHQAARVRPLGARQWAELNGAPIDSTGGAYRQLLPSGRSVALFFYDGATARAVAFEGALAHGERLIKTLMAIFSPSRSGPQLAHIATDGESYGHHHKFGDMALAYVLDQIEARQLARLTNYGEFLAMHPPTHEVEIIEKSSWSCAHGVDRWWSDCGCHTGAHPGWNQKWRTPLRDALDWLRDNIAPSWEAKAGTLLKAPWTARDDYIDVVLDRSPDTLQNFLARHAVRPLTATEITAALKLLELQRHALLMYTSCGWFFDDISGLEAVQVLRFAGRAVQLAQELFGDSLEANFTRLLAAAESNVLEESDGAKIYKRQVVPAKVDWQRLAAHYAVTSLFEDFPREKDIYCYRSELLDHQLLTAGRARLVFGLARLASTLTLETEQRHFGALHLGDHHISSGVAARLDEEAYRRAIDDASQYFSRADFAGVLRVMGQTFGESNYSIHSLFRDQRRAILNTILAASLSEAEALYRQIYEPRAPLLRFLTDLNVPLPRAFSAAAEIALNGYLRAAFERDPIEPERIRRLIDIAGVEGIALDAQALEFAFHRSLERLAARFASEPSLANLESLSSAASLLGELPFAVNLWKTQNLYYTALKEVYPARANDRADPALRSWLAAFEDLGRRFGVKVP